MKNAFRRVVRLAVAASLFLIFSFGADAQRMITGQRRFNVTGCFYEEPGVSFSYTPRVNFFFSPYYGLEYRHVGDESIKYYSESNVADTTAGRYSTGSWDITAHLGWSLPLYRTPSRFFVVSANTQINAGARIHEHRDPLRSVPKAKFLYGACIRLKLEFFVGRNISVSAWYGPRLQCYGHKHWEKSFYTDLGVGANFYIFPE